MLAPKQFFVALTPALDGAEMAYLIAAQYGIDTFKGMLDDSQNRELRIRHFFSLAGPEVGKVGFSVATGEIFVWVEVKKVQIGTVELTAVATGGFAARSITELIPSEKMLELMTAAAWLKDTYQPPDQEEIDRMFLDE